MSQQNRRRGNGAKYICTADPVGIGRKSRQYTTFQCSVYSHDFHVHCNWISCMYVFGSISSSFILRAHLYTTQSSICEPLSLSNAPAVGIGTVHTKKDTKIHCSSLLNNFMVSFSFLRDCPTRFFGLVLIFMERSGKGETLLVFTFLIHRLLRL